MVQMVPGNYAEINIIITDSQFLQKHQKQRLKSHWRDDSVVVNKQRNGVSRK